MEAVLDSNFIVSCVRKNIDFLSKLEEQGFRVLLPREVFQELKDLRLNVSHENRLAIDVALQMLESKGIKKVKLGNRNVDSGLIERGKKGAYIATLDAAIKRAVPNRIVIAEAQKSVIVERS